VILSLLDLLFVLTTFPEPSDPGFALVVPWNLGAPATLRQVPFAFKYIIKQTAMYKHTNVIKIYKTMEYPWRSSECFFHWCSNVCLSKSLTLIPAFLKSSAWETVCRKFQRNFGLLKLTAVLSSSQQLDLRESMFPRV